MVPIDILLTGKLADFEHHFVDHRSPRKVLSTALQVPLRFDRATNRYLGTLAQLWCLGIRRLDLVRANDANRIDRAPHSHRQPSGTGPTLAQLASATPGPFGVNPEQLTVLQYGFGSIKGGSAFRPA